ncbi:unnamed protein product [Lampetra planeri]
MGGGGATGLKENPESFSRVQRTGTQEDYAEDALLPSDSPRGRTEGVPPSAQYAGHPSNTPPPSQETLRTTHARVADLLQAAASFLNNLHLGGPAAEIAIAASPSATPADDSKLAAVTTRQSASISASLPARQPQAAAVATVLAAPTTPTAGSSTKPQLLQQRLPALKEFSASEGDWAAFQRRFTTSAKMSGWSEEVALQALPSALDDEALAAFLTVPPADRATPQQALQQRPSATASWIDGAGSTKPPLPTRAPC